MEDAQLYAQTLGMARLLINHGPHFFDALGTALGLQRNGIPFFRVGDVIMIVIGLEGKLRRILVAFIIIGGKDGHRFLLSVGQPIVHSVTISIVTLVNKLAFLSFIPDCTLGLVDADDIHRIVKCGALLAKHHIVGLVEHPAGLPFVGCLSYGGCNSKSQ